MQSLNIFSIGALLCAVALPLVAHSQDDNEKLKGSGEVLLTSTGGLFDTALQKAFIQPFTRDTGIKVVILPENHGKLLASVKLGQPEADITEIAGGVLASWVEKGAAEEIDYKYFDPDTLDNMAPQMKNKFGVGALLYSVGVAYNTEKFPQKHSAPKNWSDLYNTTKFPGKRALPKCEKILDGGLLEGALLGDGVVPKELYPLDLDRAYAKLKEFKPFVGRWWVAGADAPQSLIGGEADIAAAFNGRILNGKKEGAPIEFSWDQSLLQSDYWVVLKDSPNKENAMKFLAYISRPEPQAAFAEAISYGPINSAAFELLPKELASSLPGSPDKINNQVFQDNEWWNAKQSDGRTNYDVAMERCVELLSQ